MSNEQCQEVTFAYVTGESAWYGYTDLNIIDALLVGAKRIGHSYGLAKHPEARYEQTTSCIFQQKKGQIKKEQITIRRLAAENDVAVEFSPVSTQALQVQFHLLKSA